MIISRVEQRIIYYWTGARWDPDRQKAKRFDNRQQAQSEIDAVGIVYRCNINNS